MINKIIDVMRECAHIGRDAYNDAVGYPYVTAAKMNDAVNKALVANGIASLAQSKLLDIRNIGDKVLATVEVEITLTDGVDSLTIRGIGSGIDEGDKSVAKAQTMAVKYAWKNSLLVADSADEPDAVNGKIERFNPKSTPNVLKTPPRNAESVKESIVNIAVPF